MPFDEAISRFAKTKPEEISTKANRISVLAPKAGSKEISQMQGAGGRGGMSPPCFLGDSGLGSP